MMQSAGLWIDHSKAFIVMLSDRGEETLQILPGLDRQPGRMEIFYRHAMESVKNSESIFIMGPGAAKGEFKDFIDSHDRRGRVEISETEAGMTNIQIVAKVRGHFTGNKRTIRGLIGE